MASSCALNSHADKGGAPPALAFQETHNVLHKHRCGRQLSSRSLAGRIGYIPTVRDQAIKTLPETEGRLDGEMAQIVKREETRMFFVTLPRGRTIFSNASQHDAAVRALRELNTKLRHLHNSYHHFVLPADKSISSARTSELQIVSRAMLIGSLNRRGPALPGFRKRIPSRRSMCGLCE